VLDQSVSEPADDSSIVEDVVQAVAECEGVDPMRLPPLYEVCDPDALTALVAGPGEGLSVEFSYCGHRVTVDGAGVVSVDERTRSRSALNAGEH
jgi:hypothetical protein